VRAAAPDIRRVENGIDRPGQDIDVAVRHDMSAPDRADNLTTAAVVRDDDRRSAEQRFDGDEAEYLIARRVDDDVGGSESVESIAAAQHAQAKNAGVGRR